MQFSEKELENWIFSSYSNELSERGFCIDLENHKRYRQIELGKYGRLDVITFGKKYKETSDGNINPQITINIIELKIQKSTAEDIDQLLRYKNAIKEILKNKKNFKANIHCYLVVPDIESGHYTQNNLDEFYIITYKYDLSGLNFVTHIGGWVRGDGLLKYEDVKKQFNNGK